MNRGNNKKVGSETLYIIQKRSTEKKTNLEKV